MYIFVSRYVLQNTQREIQKYIQWRGINSLFYNYEDSGLKKAENTWIPATDKNSVEILQLREIPHPAHKERRRLVDGY